MRFEGNSTETARTASALELLAANWMKQELNEPVEMVLYNSHLGCYVSAMTVPCTQTGDARTSYWIHAVMPDEKERDGNSNINTSDGCHAAGRLRERG